MTPKRAAAYLILASLLIAWLASAAGTSRAPADSQEPPRPVKTAGTETLAADVQAQVVRLKDRLAAAPVPQEPARNPFTFALRERSSAPRPAAARAEPSSAQALTPAALPEPVLSLIGIAEDASPDGIVRSAIITAGTDDLFVLKTGETMGGRYRVAAIGSDAVELTDLATGAVRRLALR